MTGQTDSFFRIYLSDGTVKQEPSCSWSAVSERRVVSYLGGQKGVMVCMLPVTRIEAHHDGMRSEIAVPEGCEVYQAVRSESVVMPGYGRQDRILGRIIGIVKDDAVVEEHFLNALEYKVQGIRA